MSAPTENGGGTGGQTEEYDPKLIALLELIWGEGFLSPGGTRAVDEIIAGLDLAGRTVLDIGAGLGGVDMHLAREHGARVIGLEIEAPLVEEARRRIAKAGLADRIDIRHVQPGPLPLADASVDIVFSKDSLIHAADKAAVLGECLRVLRPGGWLAMSDWMRGPDPYSADMEYWFELEGLTYHMWPIEEYARALETAGFTQIAVADTSADYRSLARREYEQMRGPLSERMVTALGPEQRDHFVENWRVLVLVLEKGELRTGRLRAQKPVA